MTAYPTRSRQAAAWRKRALLAILAVCALLLLLMLSDLALAHNRIHSGVQIAGQDVGRLTREEAETLLGNLAAEAQEKPIILGGEGESWQILAPELGTDLQIENSVSEAYGLTRDGNPFSNLRRRLSLYFSSRDLKLQGSVDEAKLNELIGRVAEALDDPPVNAGLRVSEGDVEVIPGAAGRVVDREKLRNDLKALLFSLHQTTLTIAMKTVEPAIQPAHTQAAEQQARAMMRGAVALQSDDQVWAIGPERIASLLDFKVEGEGKQARLVAFISAEKAKELFDEVAKAVDVAPKNATWETDGSSASLIAGVTGKTLDREKTAASLTTAAASATERTTKVQLAEKKPERTTEEAKQMGVVSKLGGFTTEFSGSENRRDNVQRAAKLISGTLLAPGEEFDFDRVVGKRTAENGFKTAPAIIAGKLEDSLGGGICQVATTLFNAVFFSGLDVTARKNHSIYFKQYPKGRDATVSWGGPAFRFRNDTAKWILIKAAASRSSLTFVIYGTPDGRKVTYTTGDWFNVQSPTEKKVSNAQLEKGKTKVVDEGQTGRSVKVVRKVTRNGETLHNDNFLSKYPMRPKVVEEGTKPPASTTTTLKPTTTTSATLPASTTTTTLAT